jgi:hypothetical protein
MGWGKFRKHTAEELKRFEQYHAQKLSKNDLLKQQIGQIG